ncbi:MAG: 30S ribosomal protein S4 [Actinomycetota bacterium]
MRYTGPKVKLSRRLGVNLFENDKGARALEKRPYPPGDHGGRRSRTPSDYDLRLREKQKLRFAYGVAERQFRRLYEEALRTTGPTGHNLLRFLELRLDNVAFRAGWARTRPQSRQFAGHGLLRLNGRRVTIPSIRVRAGDVLELGAKARTMFVVRHNLDTLDRAVPEWLERSEDRGAVRVLAEPAREQIRVQADETLVVELYSR